MRCMTSGRLTPAAATLTRISPAPGVGSGRCSGHQHVRSAGRADRDRGHAGWQCCHGEVLRAWRRFLAAPARCDNAAPQRIISAPRGAEMPAIDDDDRPKKKITHEIGQDLALLSVGELAGAHRASAEEIARLEAEMARKRRRATPPTIFQEMSARLRCELRVRRRSERVSAAGKTATFATFSIS